MPASLFAAQPRRRSRLAPFILFAFLLLSLAMATASVRAQGQNNLVVPGKSVGKVALGATRAQVRKLLGKPTETAARQFPRDTWLGPKLPVDKYGATVGERIFLTVVYQNGKAAQIEFNDPRYKTKKGLSVESTVATFRKKHAPLRKTVLAYTEGGGGFVDYYLDSVKAGIAFEVGTQDIFSEMYLPHSIRIHRAGRRVIVDPGGTPATE